MTDIPGYLAKALPGLDAAGQIRVHDLFERGGNLTFAEFSVKMRDWSGFDAVVTEIAADGEIRRASGSLEFDAADYAAGDPFGLSCGDVLKDGWAKEIDSGDPIREAEDGSITWVSTADKSVLDIRLDR